jgi:hypothetical protein
MTIDQWAAQMRENLDKFVEGVKHGQATNPEQWPLEVEAGSWDEWFWNFDGVELGG